jgi:uncharacterized protein involved in exopolysaccharide biosynthesis
MSRQKVLEAMMALEVAEEIEDVLSALQVVIQAISEYIVELETKLRVREAQLEKD